MNFQLIAASQASFDVLTSVFNSAYANYVVPINLSVDAMRQTIEHYDIQLNKSCIVKVDHVVVGLGYLSIRDDRGWIGGMGVIPDYRRRGIGRAMMEHLIIAGWKAGLNAIHLEVIEGNTPAHSLYSQLGFNIIRRLQIIQATSIPQSDLYPGIAFQEVSINDALRNYDDMHTSANPWQRERLSLERAGDLNAWIAQRNFKITAYLIGRTTPTMIQIMDAAFSLGSEPDFKALLSYIQQLEPDAASSFVNLAEDDPVATVMATMGFHEALAQFEMVLLPRHP